MEAAERNLAYWGAGVFQRESVEEEHYAALVAHPRFADACKVIERASIEMMTTPKVSPIIREVSGVFYGIFTLYLDARGGLTLTAIQEFCKEAGLASPGRSAALLFALRTKGYVSHDQTQKDRRVRRYIPTPMMVGSVRNIFLNNLNGLVLIAPAAREFIERIHEPELFRAFVLGVGEGLTNLLTLRTRTAVTLFAERNLGMQILYHIMSTAAEGDVYPPKGPVEMSVSDLAAMFPASRTHIRTLLRDAERQGFIKRDTEEGIGVLCDVLRDSIVLFHASLLMGTAGNASRALAAHPVRPLRTSSADEPSIAD